MENIFQRVEKKYLVTTDQMLKLLKAFEPYMVPDAYPESKVVSVYYDDEEFDLIHLSSEHPKYKEKFRTRTYINKGSGSPAFAEIKKKLNGVVYKRRVSGSAREVQAFTERGVKIPGQSEQIQNEILWMFKRYHLKPKIWIACNRYALRYKNDKELRITFDSNLAYQTDEPRLDYPGVGHDIIDKDLHIMEIKYDKGAPMWLVEILDRYKLYPRAFSKVATALENIYKGDKKC